MFNCSSHRPQGPCRVPSWALSDFALGFVDAISCLANGGGMGRRSV